MSRRRKKRGGRKIEKKLRDCVWAQGVWGIRKTGKRGSSHRLEPLFFFGPVDVGWAV